MELSSQALFASLLHTLIDRPGALREMHAQVKKLGPELKERISDALREGLADWSPTRRDQTVLWRPHIRTVMQAT